MNQQNVSMKSEVRLRARTAYKQSDKMVGLADARIFLLLDIISVGEIFKVPSERKAFST